MGASTERRELRVPESTARPLAAPSGPSWDDDRTAVGGRCKRGVPHGPYRYLAVRGEPGRSRMLYVPAGLIEVVSRRLGDHRTGRGGAGTDLGGQRRAAGPPRAGRSGGDGARRGVPGGGGAAGEHAVALAEWLTCGKAAKGSTSSAATSRARVGAAAGAQHPPLLPAPLALAAQQETHPRKGQSPHRPQPLPHRHPAGQR